MNKKSMDKVVTEVSYNKIRRGKSYREKALKMYPWVCGKCGRNFKGTHLRELTVHHRDHNHDNNPCDGSNWELLCLYCHDNEHSRYQVAEFYQEVSSTTDKCDTTDFFSHNPFAKLGDMLKK